jgi:hypothetical protein
MGVLQTILLALSGIRPDPSGRGCRPRVMYRAQLCDGRIHLRFIRLTFDWYTQALYHLLSPPYCHSSHLPIFPLTHY